MPSPHTPWATAKIQQYIGREFEAKLKRIARTTAKGRGPLSLSLSALPSQAMAEMSLYTTFYLGGVLSQDISLEF